MTVYSNKSDYRKRLEAMEDWAIPKAEKTALREYANEYANGRITGRIGKNIESSVEGSLFKLKLPLSIINKSIDRITESDLRNFVDSLMQDKLQKKVRRRINGRLIWMENGNYAKKGKDKFLKNLALYLKFRLEDQPEKLARFLKIVKVILTHVHKEPQSLTYEQFDKIYDSCSRLADRYYLLVNAWGGFRASEFHGVRLSDIRIPDVEQGEEFVKIWIRHENSKTRGRMITLYGPDCCKIVKQYKEKRMLDGISDEEPVFEKSHNAMKLWLRRIGTKHDIALHPHLFRSTCATWLVDKGILKGYTDLIEFFGWSYGSTIPNTYLNRSRITMSHIDDKVKQTRYEELRREIEIQKEINRVQRIRSEENSNKLSHELIHYKDRIDTLERSSTQLAQLSRELTRKIQDLMNAGDLKHARPVGNRTRGNDMK